jgi:hypothetical protein
MDASTHEPDIDLALALVLSGYLLEVELREGGD